MIEEDSYAAGYLEGLEDGKISEFYSDGIKSGFLKGYALGLEIGFYEKAITELVEADSNDSQNKSEKRAIKLLQRINNIKNENDPNLDYDSELLSIRATYRLLNPASGPFLRKSDKSSTEW